MTSQRLYLKLLDPAFLLGAALTVGFYIVVRQESMHGTLLHRYTCEHAIEYVVVALFMWGMSDVFFKLLAAPREFMALRRDWLPARRGREPVAHAKEWLEAIKAQPQWAQDAKVGKRATAALSYVVESDTLDELPEQLRYLADQDEDHTQSNYTLLRFIAGITPVLGLLGTVVHFGTALSGISFDDLARRLPLVVGEIGQAFNTTTVALGTSMLMMFVLFVIERMDGRLLRSIQRLMERELLNRFEVAATAETAPFLGAIVHANEEAVRRIARTVSEQSGLWTQSLGQVFERIEAHEQRQVERWQSLLTALAQRHEAYDAQREQRFDKLLETVDTRQQGVAVHVEKALASAHDVRQDTAQIVAALRSVSAGEEKLVELQSSLTENLRLLRETQHFEDALHELTGAIHLLTARHKPGLREAA